jgi:hypothetical protein
LRATLEVVQRAGHLVVNASKSALAAGRQVAAAAVRLARTPLVLGLRLLVAARRRAVGMLVAMVQPAIRQVRQLRVRLRASVALAGSRARAIVLGLGRGSYR